MRRLSFACTAFTLCIAVLLRTPAATQHTTWLRSALHHAVVRTSIPALYLTGMRPCHGPCATLEESIAADAVP